MEKGKGVLGNGVFQYFRRGHANKFYFKTSWSEVSYPLSDSRLTGGEGRLNGGRERVVAVSLKATLKTKSVHVRCANGISNYRRAGELGGGEK